MCDKMSFNSTDNHNETREVELRSRKDLGFRVRGISFNQKVKHYVKEQVKFKRISQV